jgi:hypothetical protein
MHFLSDGLFLVFALLGEVDVRNFGKVYSPD